jgi:putative transposase
MVLNSIQKVARIIGLNQTLRYLNFSFHYYTKLKRKVACASSSLSLCRIKHPTQLLHTEVATIKKYCEDMAHQFWPISAIYHQMRKDGVGHINLSTFYKYVALLDLKRSKAYSRRKNHAQGIRANAPLQILHADLTEFKTEDNQKAYIYLVQDNYSRAILSHQVSNERRAQHTLANLEKIKAEYLLPSKVNECMLLTDDGSENYGETKKFVDGNDLPKINHVIAQVDVPQSNSMIEAANKQLKYRFLYHQKIEDYSQLKQYVDKAVEDFNSRPHHVLQGLSPMEVLKGKRYDDTAEKKRMAIAKQNRISENQKLKCCSK